MKEVVAKTVNFYYETENIGIILDDAFKVLRKIKLESVDMIFADPPYFLSNGGITCKGGEMVSVNKGGVLYKFGFDALKGEYRPNSHKFKTYEQYCYFMEQTGLFDLLENHLINNLVDYVTGVETGLDSNGRKNRGGHLMEDLVERYIKEDGFVKDETYFKEMYLADIERKWGVDLSALSNQGKASKRFDFVVKTDNTIYAIETNFYASGGSKLNETARSYKMLAQEAHTVDGFEFIWFTAGLGWKSARGNLREAFDSMEHIYSIDDLENGVVKIIFK